MSQDGRLAPVPVHPARRRGSPDRFLPTSAGEAVTVPLRVPPVRHAAEGIVLARGSGGRAETPPDRTGERPLWPWFTAIGFAFLVGWVVPPPGPAPTAAVPDHVVQQ